MKQTTNLENIEKWITDRSGLPSIVKGTTDLLRVKFDTLEDDLEDISWAKFFKIFKDNNLVFMYEQDPNSRFCKFVYKDETTK